MRESAEDSVSVRRRKELVLQCSVQLASDMRPWKPWTYVRRGELLKYVAQREIIEEIQESMRAAEQKEECVEEVATSKCLKRRMKQKLSDTPGARKRATREILSSPHGYDLTA